MTSVGLILAIIMFIVGLVGTIVPVLPGVILIFSGMVVYGILSNFETLTVFFFVLQGVATVMVLLVDYVASALGARHFNGSRQAAIGGALGIIGGLILFGPLGIVVGPFAGATIAELLKGKDVSLSIKTGFGTLIGVLGGTILKLFAEAVMIICFFISIS